MVASVVLFVNVVFEGCTGVADIDYVLANWPIMFMVAGGYMYVSWMNMKMFRFS